MRASQGIATSIQWNVLDAVDPQQPKEVTYIPWCNWTVLDNVASHVNLKIRVLVVPCWCLGVVREAHNETKVVVPSKRSSAQPSNWVQMSFTEGCLPLHRQGNASTCL